jgi:hypothetical protein
VHFDVSLTARKKEFVTLDLSFFLCHPDDDNSDDTKLHVLEMLMDGRIVIE